MKKYSLLLNVLPFVCVSALAQKASDVLENGIKVKSDQEVYLQFDGTQINHRIASSSAKLLRYKQISDSALLLPVEASVQMYMRPLNPLNYVFKAENKIVVDPIDQAAATALTSIVNFLGEGTLGKIQKKSDEASKGTDTKLTPTFDGQFCASFQPLIKDYKGILDNLKEDRKKDVNETFTALKGLSFSTEAQTKEILTTAQAAITKMENYFSQVEKSISELKKKAEEVFCDDAVQDFIVKRVFAGAVKDLEVTFSNQKKRLTNLQKAYKLVKASYDEAVGNDWLVLAKDVPAEKGKISIFTIKVTETGYKLSDQGEIVEAETKEKTTKALRVRRFQRFVPEVSVGIAYTDLSFPKYSANADGSGKQFVAEAGEDKINKVNFSTMINYNLFLDNSPLHPFWQVGIGVNADFPTLLTGIGLRVNANGVRRLALAVGVASTWIKTLDKLKVGELVSGPAQVEADVKYKFNTKPKLYFGVQYNF